MRTLTLVLTIGLLVLGVTVLARGEGSDDPVADLQEQAAQLELKVSYLMARELDLTKYLAASEARGVALEQMVARMLTQGYTNKAIPPRSRETLMAGLRALGASLRSDVPVVTEKQTALLKGTEQAK